MYPAVFKDWKVFEQVYGDMGNLPTHVFLNPLEVGDEVSFETTLGRRFYIKYAGVGQLEPLSGSRQVTFEVNGERWFFRVTDETPVLGPAMGNGGARREKLDPTNKGSIGSPMPGVVVDIKVHEKDVVKEGETLFVLSAMKMETAIKATKSGTLKRILVTPGDNVEGDDLLAEID